jgi:hypothetical protein
MCLLICSCATPVVAPAPDSAVKPSEDTVEISEPAPASKALEHREILKPDVNESDRAEVEDSPSAQRERLERRLQAVVSCLEEARQAVVAAEVAGAGIETVRPVLDALNRSEAALREAQAQWIRGNMDQTAAPLDMAEAECHTAREFNYQI